MVLGAVAQIPRIARGLGSLGEIGAKLEKLPILQKIFKTDPKQGTKILTHSTNRLLNVGKTANKKAILQGIEKEIKAANIINTADYSSLTKDNDVRSKITDNLFKHLKKEESKKASTGQIMLRSKWATTPDALKKFQEQTNKLHYERVGKAQETTIPKEIIKIINKEFSSPQNPIYPSAGFMKLYNEKRHMLFGKYRNKILSDKNISAQVKRNFKDFMKKRDIGSNSKTGWSHQLKQQNLQNINDDLNEINFNKIKGSSPAETEQLKHLAFRNVVGERPTDFVNESGIIRDFNNKFKTNILTAKGVQELWRAQRGSGNERNLINESLRQFYGILKPDQLNIMSHHLVGLRDKLGTNKWQEYLKRVEKNPGALLEILSTRYPNFSKKWNIRDQASKKYLPGIKYLRKEISEILGIDPKTMDVDKILKMGYGVHASHISYKGKGIKSSADPNSWNLSLGLSNLYKERNKLDKRLYEAISSGNPREYYKNYNARNIRDKRRPNWDFDEDMAKLNKIREQIQVGGKTYGRTMNFPALQRLMKKIGLEKAMKEKNPEMIEYFNSDQFNTPITNEGISYNTGGLINGHLTDTSDDMTFPLLDPQESIDRQRFAVGGFASGATKIFNALSKVPRAVARVGEMKKPSFAKPSAAGEVAVAQAVEDKPAMFLSTVNAIEEMPDASRMGAQQWLGTIKNKSGVSATELDEFGLEPLLNNIAKTEPKRKLTKAELLETYNREMPKIDMDIAIAEPVSRGADDITNMLTAIREKGRNVQGYEDLDIFSNDARLLTALHQPPQDRVGFMLRGKLIDIMRGTSKTVEATDPINNNTIPLLKKEYHGAKMHKGAHFQELWESAFPSMFHNANKIVKEGHFEDLKHLVKAEDIKELSQSRNIPEEEAFSQLYQALNIFDRQVMTADVPIPFWTKKMLYRLGDMSEGRGFFYKSKRTPAHEGTQFIPGGSGYGELKFYQNFDTGAVRAQETQYTAGHFSGEVFKGNTGNSPFGWGRFSERIDESGRKILLMEEIQSDLHQAIAQKGYNYAPRLDKSDVLAEIGDFAKQLDKKQQTFESNRLRKENIMQLSRVEREGEATKNELKLIEKSQKKLLTDMKKLKEKVAKQEKETGRSGKIYPNTAFQKSENYAKVFMQGLMKLASDKGYDGIALSTGKMKKTHGGIPKGGDKFYDEIGVKAMKRMAKKSGFKFKDTTIVDGNGYSWEKIPLIEMRDINTGFKIPGESTIPVYKKGGIVNQNMVRGNNGY